ncbi:hypothetical protein ABEB36_010772 [Hypothenemus hampei]|uniref:Zinc-binding domain-containing protein n=1 Tax=Hypothenemus hampei TaxID=57062 RepID=A0ABD1ED07_HYPHA
MNINMSHSSTSSSSLDLTCGCIEYIPMYDPRPSPPSPPPRVLKKTTAKWLSKPKSNKKGNNRIYTIEKLYKGSQRPGRVITKIVEEKLLLEPNTQHFRLMWTCSRCRMKIAIRHGIYDWSLYITWRDMLSEEIMFRRCKKCCEMTIGTLRVQSSILVNEKIIINLKMLSAKDVESDKKKYLALKLERDENDIAINKALAPLTTPLKKSLKIQSSPSPSSTLNVKSKAESIDTVKEEEKEEKEEEEINKSVSFLNQQPQPQQSSDDENNYDDAIGFDKSIEERNLQTF